MKHPKKPKRKAVTDKSDQVTQLSEVPADRVEDSQQDVDVGGVKLRRI